MVSGLIPEAPGRPLALEFTSRSANLSWAPPFNEDKVAISHYVIHVRKGETGEWDQTIDTETNSTFFQVGRDITSQLGHNLYKPIPRFRPLAPGLILVMAPKFQA